MAILLTLLLGRSSNWLVFNMGLQGSQQTLETLEDPEKPWIFFAPGEIPWKTLKLQPTPEKLCSEADFDASIFGFAVLLHFYACSVGEEDL